MDSRTADLHIDLGLARLLALALLAAALAALPAAAADTVYLSFTADGLDPLASGWVYEGWLVGPAGPVSTGRFKVSAAGTAMPSRFAVAVDDMESASTFVLTIEPDPDLDPGPSPAHLLAGDIVDGAATLTVGHPAALGSDLSAASGSYILNAPSSAGSVPYTHGIWWLDPAGAPDPTLMLPTLPAGWVYEGWVVGPGGPVSTGRFTDPTTTDSDGAGLSSGPSSFPPLPGQDFVTPPTDLTAGYATVVSIEPDPDTSPAPFTLKPLIDASIDDVGAGALQSMTADTSGFPTASVEMMDGSAATETAHLMLDFTGLEDLGATAQYEGWLIVDGMPVSTGTFSVDPQGLASAAYFPTEVSDLDAVTGFVLTIEPIPDPDPAPSASHLMAGTFADARAKLSVDHMMALGTDLSTVSGSYILNAPSAGADRDYRNGIWWLDPAGAPDPTLMLPELPPGWIYEGWVAGPDGPVSTGRFSDPTMADEDGAGPFSGDQGTPPFPGQDFVDPPLDLTSGYAAVISVEPDPDEDPGPFTLKPLLDPVIDDVGEGVLQPMHRNPAPLPAGTARLAEPDTIVAGGSLFGVEGVRWETDLDLVNSGETQAAVLLQLLVTGEDNSTPEMVQLILDPGMAVRYEKVFDSLFDFEGSGAIRVLSSTGEVLVNSRTYADAEAGTYGQGIPPLGPPRLVRFGDAARLVGLADNASFRSNVGFLNARGVPIELHVERYDGDSLVGEQTVTLEAYEQLQLNGVFGGTVDVGWVRVWTSTPGGAFLTYGSVADNMDDDPSFVLAQ